MMGLAFGALGVVLLGTKEGQKFAQKTINSFSKNLDTKKDFFDKIGSSFKTAPSSIDQEPVPSQNLSSEPSPTSSSDSTPHFFQK